MLSRVVIGVLSVFSELSSSCRRCAQNMHRAFHELHLWIYIHTYTCVYMRSLYFPMDWATKNIWSSLVYRVNPKSFNMMQDCPAPPHPPLVAFLTAWPPFLLIPASYIYPPAYLLLIVDRRWRWVGNCLSHMLSSCSLTHTHTHRGGTGVWTQGLAFASASTPALWAYFLTQQLKPFMAPVHF
jgi:hypothetical protein